VSSSGCAQHGDEKQSHKDNKCNSTRFMRLKSKTLQAWLFCALMLGVEFSFTLPAADFTDLSQGQAPTPQQTSTPALQVHSNPQSARTHRLTDTCAFATILPNRSKTRNPCFVKHRGQWPTSVIHENPPYSHIVGLRSARLLIHYPSGKWRR